MSSNTIRIAPRLYGRSLPISSGAAPFGKSPVPSERRRIDSNGTLRCWCAKRGSRSRRTKNNALLVNGQTVEKNEGLRPHIRWTKTPDFVHVYRGILPMNWVFFPTSTICLLRLTQAKRVFQRANKYKYFQRIVVF